MTSWTRYWLLKWSTTTNLRQNIFCSISSASLFFYNTKLHRDSSFIFSSCGPSSSNDSNTFITNKCLSAWKLKCYRSWLLFFNFYSLLEITFCFFSVPSHFCWSAFPYWPQSTMPALLIIIAVPVHSSPLKWAFTWGWTPGLTACLTHHKTVLKECQLPGQWSSWQLQSQWQMSL